MHVSSTTEGVLVANNDAKFLNNLQLQPRNTATSLFQTAVEIAKISNKF